MMEKLPTTPSQTIGPFFAYSLTAAQYGYRFNSIITNNLFTAETAGEKILITGKIFDGNNNAIHDAMIELWQADAGGKYDTSLTTQCPKGFGRQGTGTSADKRFTFKTVKPGLINGQAAHINVIIFMRGSLHRLTTRLYFSDEQNDNDPLLNLIEPSRRKTLIANKIIENNEVRYEFNIFLQGENETVFFQL